MMPLFRLVPLLVIIIGIHPTVSILLLMSLAAVVICFLLVVMLDLPSS